MNQHIRNRYAPFRGWLAHLQKLNNAGPLDISDMQAEARRKREAGETIAEYNRRQLRIIERRNPYRADNIDHDRMHERDTQEDLNVETRQSSGGKSWSP